MENEQVIAYLHHMMSAADRAAFEARLREDAALREQVSAERTLMRKMVGGISAEINQQAPPARMSFDAIAPRIAQRRPRTSWHENIAISLFTAFALIVIVFSVIYSIPDTQGGEVAPAVDVTLLAPNEWRETPTVTSIISTQIVPIVSTQIITATLEFEGIPTIPTRVPTLGSSTSDP